MHVLNILITIVYTIFLATLVLITFPIQVFIYLAIRIRSGTPVFFKQERVGKNGKIFILYKYRTMITNAEKMKQRLIHINEAKGPAFKIYKDPRFTDVGAFLSHTGLDELPQLYNIIKGDMAIFGPRPLPVDETRKLLPWQKERYYIKPGIISPWVVNGYHSNSFDEWMRSDIIYAQSKSFGGDVFLFFRAFIFFVELISREFLRIVQRR